MLETIQALDEAALLWIQEWLRCPVLDTFFSAFTQLGNAGLVWLVVSGGMLLFPKARRAGFWALVAMLFGLLCTNIVLKHLVGRVRPWLVVEGLTRLVAEHDPNSFPSGHTCAAFAAGATWARYAKKRWLKGLCIAQAVLMGFSRLYVVGLEREGDGLHADVVFFARQPEQRVGLEQDDRIADVVVAPAVIGVKRAVYVFVGFGLRVAGRNPDKQHQ